MRQYHKNPRQISKKQFAKLEESLKELGDLSGVVHDLNSDEIIGGNMRSRVFDIDQCEVQIVREYPEPDQWGTVAIGFVVWNGNTFSYRQVRWTPEQCERANLAANNIGGTWDMDVLPSWDRATLEWAGFNEETLNDWGKNYSGLKEMIQADQPVPEFKEYDEDIEKEVEYLTCPHCGKTFPK